MRGRTRRRRLRGGNPVNKRHATMRRLLNRVAQGARDPVNTRVWAKTTRQSRVGNWMPERAPLVKFGEPDVYGVNSNDPEKNKNVTEALRESRKSLPQAVPLRTEVGLGEKDAELYAKITNGKDSLEEIEEAIWGVNLSRNTQERMILKARRNLLSDKSPHYNPNLIVYTNAYMADLQRQREGAQRQQEARRWEQKQGDYDDY